MDAIIVAILAFLLGKSVTTATPLDSFPPASSNGGPVARVVVPSVSGGGDGGGLGLRPGGPARIPFVTLAAPAVGSSGDVVSALPKEPTGVVCIADGAVPTAVDAVIAHV